MQQGEINPTTSSCKVSVLNDVGVRQIVSFSLRSPHTRKGPWFWIHRQHSARNSIINNQFLKTMSSKVVDSSALKVSAPASTAPQRPPASKATAPTLEGKPVSGSRVRSLKQVDPADCDSLALLHVGTLLKCVSHRLGECFFSSLGLQPPVHEFSYLKHRHAGGWTLWRASPQNGTPRSRL